MIVTKDKHPFQPEDQARQLISQIQFVQLYPGFFKTHLEKAQRHLSKVNKFQLGS